MNKSRALMFFFVCYFCFFLFPVGAETIRERASTHFGMVKWAFSDSPPAVAAGAVTIPGGNETFAVLGSDRDAGVPAIYPFIPDLGSLDYSGIDQGLLDFLAKISNSFLERKIDGSLCHAARPFIPVIANYQLERLPPPDQVFFARPSEDENGLFAVAFRFRFSDTERGGEAAEKTADSQTLLVHVKAGRAQGNWYVCEIYFDGTRYATLARPN